MAGVSASGDGELVGESVDVGDGGDVYGVVCGGGVCVGESWDGVCASFADDWAGVDGADFVFVIFLFLCDVGVVECGDYWGGVVSEG